MNVFYKINGYVSGTTTIIGSWFLLANKTLELAEPANPDAGIVEKITTGVTIVSVATMSVYYYNKYVKLPALPKWLAFTFGTLVLIIIGLLFYVLINAKGLKDPISMGVSKICIPLAKIALGIWHVIAMIAACEEVTASRILNTINNFLRLADFIIIHNLMKIHPEVYYSVHGIRTLLLSAEGAVMLVEVTGNDDEKKTAEPQGDKAQEVH